MISVSCLDSKFLNNNNWYGRFQLIPFWKGEGLTIANALRRTLLTEKSRFYIDWVDFYNAEIPYSILTGMWESIFDILLNLKQILFTSDFILFTHRPRSPYKWINNNKNGKFTYYQWSPFENPHLLKKHSIFSFLSSLTFAQGSSEPGSEEPKDKPQNSLYYFWNKPVKNTILEKTNKIYFKKILPSPEAQRALNEESCNIGSICVKGPAVITAKHLKLPKGFKCVDPEKYLLTLTDDGIFYIRFAIKVSNFNSFGLIETQPLNLP
uniref:RNA polymerase alpha subunit n=1 Tax=Trentepohlia sp. BN17 TaxID=3063876 RepID=UPI001EDEC5DD|nr:RNA polymerase alpha subunit [Trentepohlia sp. BN17]UIB38704.1 RNA polymerase alpha subunit [Trentepohlia sp. BN17]